MFPENNGAGSREMHLLALETRIKDDLKPGFYAKNKVDGNWTREFKNEAVVGKIVGFYMDSYEHNGETVNKVIFNLQDDFNFAKIEAGLNSATKSLINTLAGAENLPGSKLLVRMYEDKNGYAGIYVEINGEKGNWKYSYKTDIPAGEEYQIPGGKTGKSYAKQEEFFINVVKNEITPQFADYDANALPVATEAEAVVPEPATDDMPF